jgi:hypothetical protein
VVGVSLAVSLLTERTQQVERARNLLTSTLEHAQALLIQVASDSPPI